MHRHQVHILRISTPSQYEPKSHPYLLTSLSGLQQVKVVGAMAFDVRSLHDVLPVVDTTADLEPTPFDRVNVQSKFFCRPLSQWESLAPRTVPSAIRSPPPEPIDSKAFITQSSTIESNRFQRFIRRMENAGPRIVLDRLKEEWHGVEGDEEVWIIRKTPGILLISF